MKKKRCFILILSIIFLICFALLYYFKPMTMNDIYDEANFYGTVSEVYETSMTVLVDENEDERASSDLINVSLAVKLNDSMTSFLVGDKVRVFYDGSIAESYPAQVDTVYAILLINE